MVLFSITAAKKPAVAHCILSGTPGGLAVHGVLELKVAAIRAEPLRPSPSEGPRRRQRGAYSRIGKAKPSFSRGFAAGEHGSRRCDEGISQCRKG